MEMGSHFSSEMRKVLADSSGVTAVGAVVAMVILGLMGGSLATLYQRESETSAHLEKRLRSWGEHHAGLERTLSDLADDDDWSDTSATVFSSETLEAGTYTVKSSGQLMDNITLTPIGFMGDGRTTRIYQILGEEVGVCAPKTDYNPNIECSESSVVVKSDAQLNAFLVDFGLSTPKPGKFKNLIINYNVNDPDDFEVHVPCLLIIVTNQSINAVHDICLDGRMGVIGGGGVILTAGNKITTISELGSVQFSQNFTITGKSLKSNALKKVAFGAVGSSGTVNISGSAKLNSSGSTEKSHALIDAGVTFNVQTIEMKAAKNVKVQAGGKVNTSGSAVMQSTGTADSSSIVAIDQDSSVTVGENLTMTSGHTAERADSSVATVTGNFHLNASSPSNCKIGKTAQFTAGSTSGNCF